MFHHPPFDNLSENVGGIFKSIGHKELDKIFRLFQLADDMRQRHKYIVKFILQKWKQRVIIDWVHVLMDFSPLIVAHLDFASFHCDQWQKI